MTERKTLRATPAMREALGIEPELEPVSAPPAPVAAAPPPAPAVRQAAPGKAAYAQKRHSANLRIGAMLAERFPEAFGKPRPLAVGIYRQLRAAIGNDELRSQDLNAFMAGWTKRPAYRAALERGERRVNLDGSDAGPAFEDRNQAA